MGYHAVTLNGSRNLVEKDGWRDWITNILAFPVQGMHYFWHRQAQREFDAIRAVYDPDELKCIHISGHSRGGAVGVYLAIMLSFHYPDAAITLWIMAAPRLFFGRWGEFLDDYVHAHCDVTSFHTYGDVIPHLPPFWSQLSGTQRIGEYKRFSIYAHSPSYYRRNIT